ncbi:MAG TPA: hypothetical protein PKY63_07610 [Bacteroidales bacterium]|nr:hypothetical protein [Bacteroidales bacterium]
MIDKQEYISYAIMVNGQHLKRWQAEAIEILNQSGLCRCVLIISNPDDTSHKKNVFGKLLNRRLLYNFLLNRYFNVGAEQMCTLPTDVPIIEIAAEQKGVSHYFTEADILKIKEFRPAFIVRFGYNILRGAILEAAPYGIWSYHHGDERKFRGGPFGFHEIRTKTPVSGVILQKLTSRLDAGQVLLRREYITVMHSWKEMRQRLLAANSDMVLQAVKMYIINNEKIPAASTTQAPVFKAPGNMRMLWFIAALWMRRVSFHIKRLLVYESWHVESGLTYNSPLVPVLPTVTNVSASNSGAFHADPFLLQTSDNLYVLSEFFSYSRKLGSITANRDEQDGRLWLQKDTHLAYPYVFSYSGEHWIIPENADSGKCIAYRVDNELNIIEELVLLDLPAVDPSLVFHEEKFYLFCGLKDQLPNEKLFVFWSDSLGGPYHAHAQNPVKVSPVGSRPGGSMINWQGNLYRPAQVSDIYYGYKILIYKILKLSPQLFVEIEKSEINPAIFGSQYNGLHTYSIYGNHYAVDLKTHRVGLAAFIFKWKQNRKNRRADA